MWRCCQWWSEGTEPEWRPPPPPPTPDPRPQTPLTLTLPLPPPQPVNPCMKLSRYLCQEGCQRDHCHGRVAMGRVAMERVVIEPSINSALYRPCTESQKSHSIGVPLKKLRRVRVHQNNLPLTRLFPYVFCLFSLSAVRSSIFIVCSLEIPLKEYIWDETYTPLLSLLRGLFFCVLRIRCPTRERRAMHPLSYPFVVYFYLSLASSRCWPHLRSNNVDDSSCLWHRYHLPPILIVHQGAPPKGHQRH